MSQTVDETIASSPAGRAEPDRARFVERSLIVLIFAGIAARLALSAISLGSLDIQTWRDFGQSIAQNGLISLYAERDTFNHPPLAGEWARVAWQATESHPNFFPFVFKLPAIVSDAIVCWLLVRIWRSKGVSRRVALLAAALFAWNLDAILVSAHHGNTDSVYAMLALLGADFIARKKHHFLGGVAIALAINVKLIPAVLILPILACLDSGPRQWRRSAAFIAGLSLGVIPFLPVIAAQGQSFARHVLGYQSLISDWGINYILHEGIRQPYTSAVADAMRDRFHEAGRWILLAAIVLLYLRIRRRNAAVPTPERSVDAYQAASMGAALFLILASGFGVQYTVFAGPLIFAVSPATGAVYGLLSGLFCLFDYLAAWDGRLPISSIASHPIITTPGPLFGLLAWGLLIVFIRDTMRESALGIRR